METIETGVVPVANALDFVLTYIAVRPVLSFIPWPMPFLRVASISLSQSSDSIIEFHFCYVSLGWKIETITRTRYIFRRARDASARAHERARRTDSIESGTMPARFEFFSV